MFFNGRYDSCEVWYRNITMLQPNEMYRRPLRDLGFILLSIKPSFSQEEVKTELMKRRLNITKSKKHEAERKGKQPSRSKDRKPTQ